MFRKATLSDLDAITSIYKAIHDREEAGISSTGWVRSIYPTRGTAQLSIEAGDMFILEEGGCIVAAARINQNQSEEYTRASWTYNVPSCKVMVLHTLAVSPAATGKGCGTRFVAFYEDYAAQHNCPYLRLDTNARNTAARLLYKKLGYTEVSIVPCVFNGIEGLELVCLEKRIE